MAALYRRQEHQDRRKGWFDFELKKARNSPSEDGSVSKMTRESPGMALGSASREVQHEDPTAD